MFGRLFPWFTDVPIGSTGKRINDRFIEFGPEFGPDLCNKWDLMSQSPAKAHFDLHTRIGPTMDDEVFMNVPPKSTVVPIETLQRRNRLLRTW